MVLVDFKRVRDIELVNVENTSYCSDLWLDVVRLQSSFRCMFELCVVSSVTVADMRRLGWWVDGQGVEM
jgi:hypothetical protein